VVLSLFESYRPGIAEERNRNSFFDAEQGVYDMAIDYAYSKGHDAELAFKYSEDSRARTLMDLLVAGGRVSGSNGDEEIIASYVVQPVNLRDLRARLPEQVQLIQYAVLEDKLLIWLLSRTQFEVAEKKITANEVNAKVLNFLRLMTADSGAREEDVRREAMSLYEILIAPVEPLLTRSQVIGIIPDKALSYLPFAALVSPRTGEYLMRDYALVSASSANVFLLCSDAARRRTSVAEEKLLSVGNPSFDHEVFRSLPDLPSAAREATQVARMYGGERPLIGPDASKERVVGTMEQADVIHFAGHYVVNERSPTLSKLLLAKSPDGEDAGVLRMHEIVRSKLERTRLIVLSACDTALERYYNGEGMAGISRSFLAAGVPLVVASQWAVDSDATAILMTNFHRHRKLGGLSTAEALRRAQAEMAGGPEERYRRPYYWAGFLLVGGHADY
jgi:CHAT domain-containing protein